MRELAAGGEVRGDVTTLFGEIAASCVVVRQMTDQVLYLTLFYQTSPIMVTTHVRNVTATSQGWNASTWWSASRIRPTAGVGWPRM